ERHLYGTFTDPKIYYICFSDSYNSKNIHSFAFLGYDISNKIHQTIEDYTYEVFQYLADDDQYGDYVEVQVRDKEGQLVGNAYIREIYSYE
ncbi:MAG: hypothetical protein K2I77_07155, partial [Anaeroplasmataceae bacterium]|nr:hypothetical protein [Anaeroplasmataceae bacterium]